MRRRLLFINPPVLVVDPFQVDLYAEAVPFGLLQIATHLSLQGHEVRVLDMMEMLDRDFERALTPERLFGKKPIGDNSSTAEREVYLYGRPLDRLDEELGAMQPPDEVYVTCCIGFNHEPAHAVIEKVRRHHPKAVIRLGGFYPTAYPEHARTSGADHIHQGYYTEAHQVLPRFDLLERAPKVWIFRLVLGCRHRCSYCNNSLFNTDVVMEPARVVDEVLAVHERYRVPEISNWDPNVMLRWDALEEFLDGVIERGSPVRLKLEMGIQPNLLSRERAEKMWSAGVRSMTIPFESAEPEMLRRFGKPYRIKHSMDAVATCRDIGFDTRCFHCTFVIGVRGESFRHVFRTYFAIMKAGGRPTPFPLTPSPGTLEHERHARLLEGKDLSDLNGHLWPLLSSLEEVRLYDLLLRIVNQTDVARARSLSSELPPDAARAFDRELDWYMGGPHRPGDEVDE